MFCVLLMLGIIVIIFFEEYLKTKMKVNLILIIHLYLFNYKLYNSCVKLNQNFELPLRIVIVVDIIIH